jgi:adenosylhomocysteine nucleosidase
MKILVVIPTKIEFDCFIKACRSRGYQPQTTQIGRLKATCFPTLDLTVSQGGLGKTQFAVQTQHLIDMAHWDLVICAGAAGALVDDLSKGDVVIATQSVEHDIKNKFGGPLLPHFDTAEHIVALCRQSLPPEPGFHVQYGPIASGDEDVVDRMRRESIQKQTGALAVAWEGAGGARAAQFNGVPYIEIRGVTDSANGIAAFDFMINLKKTMRNVAHVVLSLALRSVNSTKANQPQHVTN